MKHTSSLDVSKWGTPSSPPPTLTQPSLEVSTGAASLAFQQTLSSRCHQMNWYALKMVHLHLSWSHGVHAQKAAPLSSTAQSSSCKQDSHSADFPSPRSQHTKQDVVHLKQTKTLRSCPDPTVKPGMETVNARLKSQGERIYMPTCHS